MIFKPHSKIYIVGTIMVLAIGIVLVFAKKGADSWLCKNGQWVMQGSPNTQKPITGCGQAAPTNIDPLNTTYIIENKQVALKNGQAQTPAAPGLAEQVTTKIFNASAQGDVNGDGLADTAVILTQNSGGSGTFYYVAAAIKTQRDYQGTNAVLLGDRIAPQNMEIKDGQIIANFSQRKIGEDFSIQPSVGVSQYLEFLNNTLTARPEAMQVTFPYPYGKISSPLKITGQARGNWFFEASFPVILTDSTGATIAQGTAKATGDWMTQNFVPFEAALEFTKPTNKNTGSLILKKDNPSGLPQNNETYKVPIIFN